ncbi:protein SAWADEE HOMEODOMAIN HOMOLOG 2-like isoform X2 [Papaver somniferum]|uniref:protein SAWADEE HOMEODOMAIN HOMOLOG 2-like isoform X2 n=1 Tax=Papaver somniferum TaxID=3469 RepID=UPI000E6FB7FE|nr:protein SAWADEE HOMEODOMAIN HOMOLOG 2-like isoform X2 [Papaver somniferum]
MDGANAPTSLIMVVFLKVAEMDALLLGANNTLPTREVVCTLAETFSAAPERAGKSVVQWKQVWNWFQNRRYSLKAKLIRTPGKLNVSSLPRDDSGLIRNLCNSGPLLPGTDPFDNNARVEFEAKSARDGAWYDVATFVSHRLFETGDPEVRVRFAGFTPDEDEWVNVRKHVRHSSIPCLAAECGAILPGDLVLCFQSLSGNFQERQGQALYLDAHVIDAQRWRHDVRGCRCRFLVRYDHDQSEEIVPLRKLCRRPESDHRLQLLYASKEPPLADLQDLGKDHASLFGTSESLNSTPRKTRKRHKPKVNADVSQSSHSGERSISWMKSEKFDDSSNNYNNFRTSDEPIRDAAAAVAALVIGNATGTDSGSVSVMPTNIEGGGI